MGEVFIPAITTGMKEPYDCPAFWIDARQIGALAQIAVGAGERKVTRIITPTMLTGNNMLNVKAQFGNLLR